MDPEVVPARQVLAGAANAVAEPVLPTGDKARIKPASIVIGVATAGIVTAYPSNWYETPVMEGVLGGSRMFRHDIIFFNGHPTDDIDANVLLYKQRCDGLLHLSYDIGKAGQRAIQRAGIPLVCLGGPGPAGAVAYTNIDDIQAMRDVTSHLIELGHRRLCIVLGDRCEVSDQRFRGFRLALEDGGIPIESALVIQASHTVASGSEAAHKIFGMPRQKWPTAIACFNDAVAMGLMAVARQLKISIPDEISVAGIDDIVDARLSRPALTTVRQPLHGIGEAAVELLADIIAGKTSPTTKRLLPHELIVRGSTAPPSGV